MGKNIIVKVEEGGIVRPFDVFVEPGMTSLCILSRWGLTEHFLQDAVTNLIYPRRSDIFPLVSEGQILEPIHESLLVGE
jgi:hypothetical protein